MRLGVQVSTEGKIYEAVNRAHRLGCNTMQIFSRSPQQWRNNFLPPQEIKEFIKRKEEFKIEPVFVHIPYLVNLASPNPKLYRASIKAYIEDIQETAALKANYLVTHMGSHKDTSEEQGLSRLIEALNKILEETKNTAVGLLLENTAGSGSWLGYKFIHHNKIIQGLRQNERVGLCLDTAHAYLAGYDLATPDGLQAMLDEIERLIGLSRLKLIHLNDAKGALGARHDRHQHIGRGHIGRQGIQRIINHPKLINLPFILETPKDTVNADEVNLGIVRRLRK